MEDSRGRSWLPLKFGAREKVKATLLELIGLLPSLLRGLCMV